MKVKLKSNQFFKEFLKNNKPPVKRNWRLYASLAMVYLGQ
jgi:hypothetical protein